MTLWLGKREVQIIHIGRSHTAGDTVVWLPKERVLFAGDTVEFGATPYCGDAHFTDWPGDARGHQGARPGEDGAGPRPQPHRPRAGRGGDRRHLCLHLRPVWASSSAGVAQDRSLKQIYDEAMSALRPKYGHWVIFEHCMPFDVSRAYDEAKGSITRASGPPSATSRCGARWSRAQEMKSAEIDETHARRGKTAGA